MATAPKVQTPPIVAPTAQKAFKPEVNIPGPTTTETPNQTGSPFPPPTGNPGGPNTGGGGGGGGTNPYQPYNGPPRPMVNPQMSNQYQGQVQMNGGPKPGAVQAAGQSFSDPSRLQGAVPFWQSAGIQVGAQHGYDPGQQFAGQQVTGQSIQNNPMVAAALQNYQQNVLPGINDQMNTMGLGRSTAALNAMSKAQAGMLSPLYSQAADLENQAINRQTQQGQFDAGVSQQDLSRLQGATESELGRRQQSSQQQAQGQQQLFQNLMQMSQAQTGNQQAAGQGLFGMGTQAQQTGQQVNQNAYQDFLRQQGLSEEAINPFGGIQGLLGTTTSGK